MIEHGEALHIYGSIYFAALIIIGFIAHVWRAEKKDKEKAN